MNGRRLLYVDDDRLLASTLARRLARSGYSVSVKTDPRDALTAFVATPNDWDLLLTDYSMPNVSGLELARRIHSLRPDLPIIMITGHKTLAESALAAAGVLALLEKPVSVERLIDAFGAAAVARSNERCTTRLAK